MRLCTNKFRRIHNALLANNFWSLSRQSYESVGEVGEWLSVFAISSHEAEAFKLDNIV